MLGLSPSNGDAGAHLLHCGTGNREQNSGWAGDVEIILCLASPSIVFVSFLFQARVGKLWHSVTSQQTDRRTGRQRRGGTLQHEHHHDGTRAPSSVREISGILTRGERRMWVVMPTKSANFTLSICFYYYLYMLCGCELYLFPRIKSK